VRTGTDSALGQTKSAGRGTPKPILLVESVFQSAVLMSRVFRELNLLDQLAISMDCENALVRLRQPGGDKPRLILLDRNMPRMSAGSFLEVVKEDHELRMVPVVVLADSHDAEEVARYYGLGAAGYMVKAGDYTDVLDKMGALCAYWMLSRSPMMY
jgi:CheY-like chemotaxis protein